MGVALPGALAIASPVTADGTLVIVGGALKSENAAVHRAFIDALPDTGKVVIIPAASGSPSRSGAAMLGDLSRYGLSRDRIELFPVAVRDDASTPDRDESTWAKNAWNEELVSALGQPAGFWFTGGDQTRITETLLDEQGKESPLLELIRKRLAQGATVGGTSAGAAIMSDPMIAGGESFAALTEPLGEAYDSMDDQESGRLLLGTGLGFLPDALVDQHFDRKARLGRLVRALEATGAAAAYGIDEDTALVVDLESGKANVAGSGGVTMLYRPNDGEPEAEDGRLMLGFAGRDAHFTLGRCDLGGPIGEATPGQEYFDYPVSPGGGMAFANQRLDQVLGYDLLDNRASRSVSRLSLHEDGRLLEYRFTQTPGSQGFWTDQNGPSRYSVCGVEFRVIQGQWRRE